MEMLKQSILLVGSSGFLGASFLEYLKINDLDLEVFSTNIFKKNNLEDKDLTILDESLPQNVTLIVCAGIKKQFGDSFAILLKNNNIAENISKFILKTNKLIKVIYISSAEVYDVELNNSALTESSPLLPRTFYGVHKMYMENLVEKICLDKQLKYLFLRPPLIYGIKDTSFSYGPSGFLSSAFLNKKIQIWGDGEELREFIYIDDFCSVLLALVYKEVKSGPINVVSGNSYSFQRVFQEINNLFPSITKIMSTRTQNKVNVRFKPDYLMSIMGEEFEFTNLEAGLKKMTIEAKALKWP